jgi:hypothetical protein
VAPGRRGKVVDDGPASRRKPPRVAAANTDDDDRNNKNRGRTSLKLGSTSRKGRSAELTQRRGSLKKRDRSADKEYKEQLALSRKTVQLPPGSVSVRELADLIDEKPVAVIKFLMSDLGIMASLTQNLDPATCIAVVEGFGKIVGNDDQEL